VLTGILAIEKPGAGVEEAVGVLWLVAEALDQLAGLDDGLDDELRDEEPLLVRLSRATDRAWELLGQNRLAQSSALWPRGPTPRSAPQGVTQSRRSGAPFGCQTATMQNWISWLTA